jgi:hypothetical protein
MITATVGEMSTVRVYTAGLLPHAPYYPRA